MRFSLVRLRDNAGPLSRYHRQPARVVHGAAIHQRHCESPCNRIFEGDEIREPTEKTGTCRLEAKSSLLAVAARFRCVFDCERVNVYAKGWLHSSESRAGGVRSARGRLSLVQCAFLEQVSDGR